MPLFGTQIAAFAAICVPNSRYYDKTVIFVLVGRKV